MCRERSGNHYSGTEQLLRKRALKEGSAGGKHEHLVVFSSFRCKMQCFPKMQKNFKHKDKLSQKWTFLGFYQNQKSRADKMDSTRDAKNISRDMLKEG